MPTALTVLGMILAIYLALTGTVKSIESLALWMFGYFFVACAFYACVLIMKGKDYYEDVVLEYKPANDDDRVVSMQLVGYTDEYLVAVDKQWCAVYRVTKKNGTHFWTTLQTAGIVSMKPYHTTFSKDPILVSTLSKPDSFPAELRLVL